MWILNACKIGKESIHKESLIRPVSLTKWLAGNGWSVSVEEVRVYHV